METKELHALISLLDDNDPEVYRIVEGNLYHQGIEIVPELEKVWENSSSDVFHLRIENLIHSIQFSHITENFKHWFDSGGTNLLEGAFWVAKYHYPDLQYNIIKTRISEIQKSIWADILTNLTPLEKVKVVNHSIFNIFKFVRSASNFYAPQNCFINQVLDQRSGNPISLAIIYLCITQSLHLPIYGVNLARNFILAYLDENPPTSMPIDEQDQVMFYINPYSNGAILGRQEIDTFLKQQKIEKQKSFYTPCTNTETIKALLVTLLYSYNQIGFIDKVKDIEKLLKIYELKDL